MIPVVGPVTVVTVEMPLDIVNHRPRGGKLSRRRGAVWSDTRRNNGTSILRNAAAGPIARITTSIDRLIAPRSVGTTGWYPCSSAVRTVISTARRHSGRPVRGRSSLNVSAFRTRGWASLRPSSRFTRSEGRLIASSRLARGGSRRGTLCVPPGNRRRWTLRTASGNRRCRTLRATPGNRRRRTLCTASGNRRCRALRTTSGNRRRWTLRVTPGNRRRWTLCVPPGNRWRRTLRFATGRSGCGCRTFRS